jgi:hypothetical protein
MLGLGKNSIELEDWGISFFEFLLLRTLIVLLVETDAHGCYQSHINAGCDLDTVRLLPKEEVLSTKYLAVDASH